ncbi:hypothetical protein JVT61DRAFT_3150 [Boletus reticuloceps]|uniref:Uncharacterized protein n=1 Tax=Boletus reticuloceps TaxID=495285 RepID=A0A8I2YPB5_9AGAM|nr:hypothetical protein JVT61DRAFT_3150 [Boletus reticuloceps]
MDCPSTSLSYLHYNYPTQRSQRSLIASQLSQSPITEYPTLPPHYSAHEAKFDVQVRVQRSFSFEELQSGSYFASLDESDLQFYRVYGQPVLIPSPDEVDANFVVHGAYPTADPCCEPLQNNGLHFHYPPAFSTKSYTLLNPLGEDPSRSTPSAPQLATPSYDWQRVKQEPIEAVTTYSNPALSAIACQLYTLPDQDDDSVMSPSDSYADDQKPMITGYDEPPMDSLPYPPPASSMSPPYFQASQSPQATQDSVILASPFIHDASFHMSNGRDEWEDNSTRAHSLILPRHSRMLTDLPSPVSLSRSLSQPYPSSSSTRSHRRHSRSPSPRSSLHMSPTHTKRSLDKKPALACLFCRGRKIACGPPEPGSKDKTCK